MWDKTYATDIYIYGEEPNQFLQQNTQHLAQGNVLCLADGEGRNSVFLAKLGFNVTAVDLSLIGLEKARKLAAKHQVEVNYIHADLAQFDLGTEQWDNIVAIFCHLPQPLRQALHQRLASSLKPNGVYLVEGYTPEQLNYKTGGPPQAEMMLSQSILQNELQGLNFHHLQELEREIHEGINHHGIGCVVQGIGTKK